MKAIALLLVLLLAVVLLPARHEARPRNHPPLRGPALVRVVRSPSAAQVPKTVRSVGGR